MSKKMVQIAVVRYLVLVVLYFELLLFELWFSKQKGIKRLKQAHNETCMTLMEHKLIGGAFFFEEGDENE